MPIPIETAIQQHTDIIISGKISSPEGCCPRCFTQPKFFKLHECRKRYFRYTVGCFVKVILTLLARWRCSECGKTFTVYPSFALPHKRYVLVDIQRLSNKYLEDEQQTFNTAVTYNGSSIGYEEKDGENVDHFLAPSTLWRWIQGLRTTNSSLKEYNHIREHKIQQSLISCGLKRLFSKRYRGLYLPMLLQNTSVLSYAGQKLRHIFTHIVFPHFATVFYCHCYIYSFP